MISRDGARLAVGTFTRIPVHPPTVIDRRVAGQAMVLAPIVGAALGAVTGLPLLLMTGAALGDLLMATVTVTACALITRAMHWDGLADTVDALASNRAATQALEIARRSDVGPMGVLAIVLVALLQITGLAAVGSPVTAYGAWVLACLVGRLGVMIACREGVPPARSDGLGAAVAGSVKRWKVAIVVVLLSVIAVVGLAMAQWWIAATFAGLLASWRIINLAKARLGGITGDVLGAIVESSTAAVTAMAGLIAVLVALA